MQVGVGSLGHIEVDDEVNLLDIDSSGEHVGSDHDPLAALLELFVLLNSGVRRRGRGLPLLLVHPSVDSDGLEVHVVQEVVQHLSAGDLLAEDHGLVVLQLLQQTDQNFDLLGLSHCAVVLDESVEGEFALIVDEDLFGVLSLSQICTWG